MTQIIRNFRTVARRAARKFGITDYRIYGDRQSGEYIQKKKFGVSERDSDIKCLVLGSSHADFGFDCAQYEGSYNLALTSADLYTSYHCYLYASNVLGVLNEIILFYSVFSPGFNLMRTEERYRAVAYRHYLGVPYSNPSLICRRRAERMIRELEKVPQVDIEAGYWGYDRKLNYLSHVDAVVRTRTHLRENRREPTQIVWIERLISKAQADGTHITIVVPPFRSDYIDALGDAEFAFRHLSDLDRTNVTIRNLMNSSIFDDEDMGDADHLNSVGAAKLARYLRGLV